MSALKEFLKCDKLDCWKVGGGDMLILVIFGLMLFVGGPILLIGVVVAIFQVITGTVKGNDSHESKNENSTENSRSQIKTGNINQVQAAQPKQQPKIVEQDGFVIEEGVLTKYNGTAKDLSIPENVKEIGKMGLGKMVNYSGRFYDWEKVCFVEKVHIPKSVQSLQKSAFGGCNYLTTVTIDGDDTLIEERAFNSCTMLSHINLPSNALAIRSETFERCKNLKEIVLPEKLERIGAGAFQYSGLVEIVIPANVSKIDYKAFNCCEKLERVTVPYTDMQWGPSVFAGCKRLRKITLPNLTILPVECFQQCTELAEVEWPQRMIAIEHHAFRWCPSLNNVTLPESIAKIGTGAFEGCRNLESINFPPNLREIGENAFQSCRALSQIALPQSLSEINCSTFSHCSNLSEVSLPSGLERIGKEAFFACENLRSIRIPKSVISIEQEAFADCRRLANVIVESGEVYVEENAFAHCDGRLTIHAPSGSPMQRFAKNHGIAFAPLPDQDNPQTRIDEITIADFVVRSNNFKCYFEHDIELVQAVIGILLMNGEVKQEKIMAGYCRDCNCYYILESSFKTLQTRGILLCQLITLAELAQKGAAIFDREGMKAQSMLRRCGYTVNASDNLSPARRQKILALVIDKGLYSSLELCNFLDWMINYHGRNSTRDMSSAVRKWTEDRNFVENYVGPQGREVVVKSISYR